MSEVWVISYERTEYECPDFTEVREVCDSIEYIKKMYEDFGEIVYEDSFNITIKKSWSEVDVEYIYGERMDVNSLRGKQI